MATQFKSIIIGCLDIYMYTFENVGDSLPNHSHTEEDAHITIISRGKVRVVGPKYDMEFSTGSMVNFPPNHLHEIISMEPNTRVFNILTKYNPDKKNEHNI